MYHFIYNENPELALPTIRHHQPKKSKTYIYMIKRLIMRMVEYQN